MAPSQAALSEVPQFSLYGDGRAIWYTPTAASSTAPAPLHLAQLTEAQIQSLLRYALDAGGLRTAGTNYRLSGVSDAATSTFTIDAGGVNKSVSVYALGMTAAGGSDSAARASFQALATKLGDFGTVVQQGEASDEGPFSPTSYRAYLLPGQATGVLRDWPWSDLSPQDFTAIDGSTLASHTLTVAQARLLAPAPGAGVIVPVQGNDRAPYVVVMIPLLPDQL